MIELEAPEKVECGKPIQVRFRADERMAGRLRLTSGTEALTFTLLREGKEPVTSSGPRLRGREGMFALVDWGEHPSGTELVLRYEGAKCWIVVV